MKPKTIALTRRQLRVLRSLAEPAKTAGHLAPRVVRIAYEHPLAIRTVRDALEELRDLDLVIFRPPVGWVRTLKGDGFVLDPWLRGADGKWRRP